MIVIYVKKKIYNIKSLNIKICKLKNFKKLNK